MRRKTHPLRGCLALRGVNGDSMFSRFRFSLKITLICLFVSLCLFRIAAWQWSRYHWKQALVETYRANRTSESKPFPASELVSCNKLRCRLGQTQLSETSPIDLDSDTVASLQFHKVRIRGRYDYSNELIITNRKNGDGPGHILLTPFILDGLDTAVWVSRGFIPFRSRSPSTWTEYLESTDTIDIDVVFLSGKTPKFLGPRNPEVKELTTAEARIWFFEQTSALSQLLPYDSFRNVFVQRIGPPVGSASNFPEEAISIQVPPSTHFGYTIEWTLLGLLVLSIGFLKQLFAAPPKPPIL